MMWPFRRAQPHRTLGAVVTECEGGVQIDVRGQTCPGYLLSINRAVGALPPATNVVILTSYAPCGADVEAWCKEKGYAFHELRQDAEGWALRIRL